MKTSLFNPIFINPQAYFVFPQLYDITPELEVLVEPCAFTGTLTVTAHNDDITRSYTGVTSIDLTEFAGNTITISQHTDIGATILGSWKLDGSSKYKPHPGLFDAWFASGFRSLTQGVQQGMDSTMLKAIPGVNSLPAQCFNFGWNTNGEKSDFNGFSTDFSWFTGYEGAEVTKKSITFTKTSSNVASDSNKHGVIVSIKGEVKGLPENTRIQCIVHSIPIKSYFITQNGPVDLQINAARKENVVFSLAGGITDPVTITLTSEYDGMLIFDGVDDGLQLWNNNTTVKGSTIGTVIINFINLDKGITVPKLYYYSAYSNVMGAESKEFYRAYGKDDVSHPSASEIVNEDSRIHFYPGSLNPEYSSMRVGIGTKAGEYGKIALRYIAVYSEVLTEEEALKEDGKLYREWDRMRTKEPVLTYNENFIDAWLFADKPTNKGRLWVSGINSRDNGFNYMRYNGATFTKDNLLRIGGSGNFMTRAEVTLLPAKVFHDTYSFTVLARSTILSDYTCYYAAGTQGFTYNGKVVTTKPDFIKGTTNAIANCEFALKPEINININFTSTRSNMATPMIIDLLPKTDSEYTYGNVLTTKYVAVYKGRLDIPTARKEHEKLYKAWEENTKN